MPVAVAYGQVIIAKYVLDNSGYKTARISHSYDTSSRKLNCKDWNSFFDLMLFRLGNCQAFSFWSGCWHCERPRKDRFPSILLLLGEGCFGQGYSGQETRLSSIVRYQSVMES